VRDRPAGSIEIRPFDTHKFVELVETNPVVTSAFSIKSNI